MRTTLSIAAALSLALAGAAAAQSIGIAAGGASDGPPPGLGDDARSNRTDTRVPAGDPGAEGNSTVSGTTPGMSIGGTPTSGPPGTGGTAGGPPLGNR